VPDRRLESETAAPFIDRMEHARIPEAAMASFRFHLARLVAGDRGDLGENEIEPVEKLPDADAFEDRLRTGVEALRRVAVIKLNGGLGTSMGLECAKSLLPVRDDLSFLDLIARQVLALRSEVGTEVPLLLMDSFRTAQDTRRVLEGYPELVRRDLPLSFLQHRVPKIDADHLLPVSHPSEPELEWCPPGHGDLYTALATSGALDRLLDADIEYAFVSNSDNLGAVVSPELLGYMVEEELDFMLEASDRTAADRKGGHLCRLANGRLALRESAQCPPGSEDAFQDIQRYRYFNTNNVWLRLPALSAKLAKHGGFLPLPTLVNRKTVDPREPSSTEVYQLETAMGSAISLFARAAAVRVARRRFSPVKNTDDLLAARSDAYELTENWLVRLHPDRETPPAIRLDPAHYKLIDAFEERFPHGPPSLRRCSSLTVDGDITFGAGIVVDGDVVVRASRPTTIPDRSVLTGTSVF
jgi:UTP--glucose-1-phosphate uridylyltransferase